MRLAALDIAGTAFDNVVAYQEGQGAVKFDRQPDLFAFMGATQVELAFIVAPEIVDDFAQLDEAIAWAARIAKACRCDQELRVFGLDPQS